ncbi:BrnA antitoxin family protein [Faucicola mancuniensis]|uniref:BrnA antitoxin family protein n=1 Tax=Faucicola mancuniensis TaxID=1309795 RepID=UPI003977E2BB
MNKHLINEHGEVRELTQADFTDFAPATDILPTEFLNMVKTRGKQKTPTKSLTSIRLDSDVIDYFKQHGKGWQTRLNNALREYIATQPTA